MRENDSLKHNGWLLTKSSKNASELGMKVDEHHVQI
jgi:hypothetical protein